MDETSTADGLVNETGKTRVKSSDKKRKSNKAKSNNNNNNAIEKCDVDISKAALKLRQEENKEEEDLVPDLPLYEDQSSHGGLRKFSRGKSSTDNTDGSEESNCVDIINGEANGLENSHKQTLPKRNHSFDQTEDIDDHKPSTENMLTEEEDDQVNLLSERRNAPRRKGVVEQPDLETVSDLVETPFPPVSRRRRSSTVDLSRSAQKLLLRMYTSGSTSPYPEVSSEPAYCNPEMEIFRQRRLSQQNQQRRRLSLADIITDWPSLDYIEKPEYRMPEFKENETGEAQSVELRKMDPSAIYKMDSWIDELEDQTCLEKESKVVMTCRYSNPNAKFRWYKNNLEIFHGHKYNFDSDNGVFRLNIFRLSAEDTGEYSCQTDDKRTSAFLTVEEKKQEYQFIQRLPETATARHKGELVMECTLSASKPPVTWRINDDIIEYTPGVYEIFRRDNRCILKIRNVRKEMNDADVSCEVYGDTTKCRLIVGEPEYRFVRHLADVDSFEKETAVFECEINDAEAQGMWLKNDLPITLGLSKFVSVQDGAKRQLLIHNVCAQDEGIYSFSVQNKQSWAKLFVEPDVVIRERLQDIQKVENETVKFMCKVKNPKNYPVVWLKAGKVLGENHDQRYEIINKEGKTHCLTIKSLKLSDAGTYVCKIGDRESSATLTVAQSHIAPKANVDTVPRELTVHSGTDITIDIPYTGAPKPLMEWTKNGSTLRDGGSVEMRQTANMCLLRVNNACRADSAEYELHLANDSGTEVVPITVKVIGKPLEPEGPLRVVDVYKDRCRLMWEAPIDDGGLDIEYYLVEMQDTSLHKWTEIGKVQGDTQCGIPVLEPNKKYRFRVSAHNSEGYSEPLATEKEILARDPWDPPGKPGRPDVVDYDKDRAEIQWTPSVNDGRAPIQKYVIEKRLLPDSTWHTIGMVLPHELYAIVPDLEMGKFYEFRVLAVNRAGRGEPSDPSTAICIKPTRVPPSIDQSSFKKETVLKAGRDFHVEMHFTGKPTPTAVWSCRKCQDLTCRSKISVSNSEGSSQMTCVKVSRDDSDVFVLTLQNDYGTDTAEVTLTVIDVPSSPVGPLTVSDIRNTNAVLHWQPPIDDGGRPLLNYVIEKMNANSSQWERACSSVPNDVTQFKVSRLEEGHKYLFRVSAVNDQGTGPALTTEFETLAINPFVSPDAPEAPVIVDSDSNFITLRWMEPARDGGATITGYYIERRDKNTGLWIRLNQEPVPGFEFTDRTVKEKKQYEYRVIAENEGGMSKPSTESVTARATLFKEKGHINNAIINGSTVHKGLEGNSTVNVRAGGVIRIDLQVSGSPPPVVSWLKDNKPIPSSARMAQVRNGDDAYLQISNATRQDSGIYTAVVQNDLGSELSSFHVEVLDVPSSPQMPCVDDVFSDHCRVSWKPPLDDGGSEIIGYSIEVCEENRTTWEKVTSFVAGLMHNVKDLKSHRKYKFRVCAENMFGASQPAETNVITLKNPYDAPSVPSKPEVADGDNDFILLKWKPPVDDGGASILGYNIERKDALTNRWVKLNTQLVTMTEYSDRNVQVGKQYEYRVTAINAGGSSEFSETSGLIKAKPYKACPSINVSLSGHNVQASVGETLTITVPITGSPAPTITWFKNGQLMTRSPRVNILNGEDVTRLVVYGVTADDSGSYTVLVKNSFGQASDTINVNILGRGQRRLMRSQSVEPTSSRDESSESVELRDHSPLFTFPLRNRLIQQGVGVKLIACVTGRPMPKITWYKDSQNITHDNRYSISNVVGVCSLEITSCTLADAGKYTCTASNTLGTADTVCRVAVHERQSRRSFSLAPSEDVLTSPSAYNGHQSP